MKFDDTLVHDDPVSSGFRTPELADEFDAEGRALTLDLQRELGDAATVRYWRDAT